MCYKYIFISNFFVRILSLISETRVCTGSLQLTDTLKRPALVEADGHYDLLLRGLATQSEKLTDTNFDPAVKDELFRRNHVYGQDLRAIDIQRSRDHGLGRYNDYREFCGLGRATSWNDYCDLIPEESVEILQSLYASFEDVDLTVGGALETHVEGTLAGPTFLCIITKQFHRTRLADRFFFERDDEEIGFTPSE